MFKKLFPFFLLFLVQNAFAKTPWEEVPDLKCSSEFIAKLRSENWNSFVFREHVSVDPSTKVYRNFSQKIGEWLELHLSASKSPVIYQVNNDQISKWSFSAACAPVVSNEAWPYEVESIFAQKSKDDFTNEELKKIVASSKKAWIYFWSPKFSYSVTDMPRVEKLASEFGLDFYPIVDPRASEQEIRGALEVLKKMDSEALKSRSLASEAIMKRNLSTDLYMRNGFNHFPVIYVVGHQKIHDRFITGIMTKEGLRSMTSTFLKELK